MNSTPIDRNLARRKNTDMIEHLHTAQDDEQRLDQAFDWLCKSRKTAPDNADVWDLRFHWATRKGPLLQALQTGSYQLQPMQIVGKNRQVMWSAENALALKWLALDLENTLPLHRHCEHIKGHGGGKASIQQRHDDITQAGYRWVCRTDIKGYYQHINKTTLFTQLQQHVRRPAYLNLLQQYLHYSVEDGGEFFTPETGIARGCSLSPLMGAFHLWALDNHFAHQKKIAYARYMDDFVILAHTRWSLRKQVKRLNQFFNEYGFTQHPDKTFIGKVEKGFDWLGGQFGTNGLKGVSLRAWANHVERLRQLYEQTQHWTKERQKERVARYRKRWKIWRGTVFTFILGGPLPVLGYNMYMDPGGVKTVNGIMSEITYSHPGTGQMFPGNEYIVCMGASVTPTQGNIATCTGNGVDMQAYPQTVWPGATIPANTFYTAFHTGNGTVSWAYISSLSLSVNWHISTQSNSAIRGTTLPEYPSPPWSFSHHSSRVSSLTPETLIGGKGYKTGSGAGIYTSYYFNDYSPFFPYVIHRGNQIRIGSAVLTVMLHPNAAGGVYNVPEFWINGSSASYRLVQSGTVYVSRTCTVPAVDSIVFPSISSGNANEWNIPYLYEPVCHPALDSAASSNFIGRITSNDESMGSIVMRDASHVPVALLKPTPAGSTCAYPGIVNVPGQSLPSVFSGGKLRFEGVYRLCNVATSASGVATGTGLITYTWR